MRKRSNFGVIAYCAATALVLSCGSVFAGQAATHCTADETVLFSCPVGKKTMSFCAVGPAYAPQYRFGTVGQPVELVYPAVLGKPGITVEELTGSSHIRTWFIRFTNANTDYELVAEEARSDTAPAELWVSVHNKDTSRTNVQLVCKYHSEVIDEGILLDLASEMTQN